VRAALKVGYRHFDDMTFNEHTDQDFSKALKDSGIPRSEMWISSKVHDNSFDSAQIEIQLTLETLGLDYLDMVLLLSPSSGRIVETWDALLAAKKQGLVRTVGVSNFGEHHLAALERHKRPLPAVNQIEMHPLIFNERKSLAEYCKARGILIQAYGSIFSGQRRRLALRPVSDAAKAHARTPAQVLLRWGFQKGFQLIPKSITPVRIAENANIFTFSLSDDEMAKLDAMHVHGSLGEHWNPVEETHVDVGDLKYFDEL
jgi:diketogulonate reductase-like aldo/keto reductase